MLPLPDLLALLVWLFLWLGYQWFALKPRFGRQSLTSVMVPIRRKWMLEALQRENRISDASLVGNLMNSATFFSSTTLLILGGLFAFISSLDKNAAFVSNLPFAEATTLRGLEVKFVVLAFVFIYALFRFLWSIRQFNLLTILLGAYPAPPGSPRSEPMPTAFQSSPSTALLNIVEQATRLNALAGNNFAQALRAYYYAVPVLLWLVNPWLLLSASLVVTSAVYFTEYHSHTAQALWEDEVQAASMATAAAPYATERSTAERSAAAPSAAAPSAATPSAAAPSAAAPSVAAPSAAAPFTAATAPSNPSGAEALPAAAPRPPGLDS